MEPETRAGEEEREQFRSGSPVVWPVMSSIPHGSITLMVSHIALLGKGLSQTIHILLIWASVATESRRIPGKPDCCPSCGKHDIRPSVVRGMLDAVMSVFSYAPYRCRACERRFYRHMREADQEEPESQSNAGQ